ncbi:MAG: asparagine synthase (glutamine-hydrolyzing) [Armatimonadetes bacterium]|nr:asparagine synthase (glutamine-hydrolyzing) [Armatimonadota bacterium]
MCGIAGYVRTKGSPVAAGWARNAECTLEHRGPDDSCHAVWSGSGLAIGRIGEVPPDGLAGLVHRRLSIIDLSPLGRQPMVSPEARFVSAFNGEIYNYREIRARLEARGERFQSQSDSEVLLRSFSLDGPSSLDEAVGMYALAVLDLSEKTLFLARDPAGIKPLYWVQTDAGFAFASEPAVLLEWPGVGRGADPQGLVDYLRFGFTDHRDTGLFADVNQLRAGSHMSVELETCRVRPSVRTFTFAPRAPFEGCREQAATALKDVLCESVDLHLRADVPVATCLSGGIDSSTIAMLMRHVGGPQTEIHSFSHLARGTAFDEERYMDMVNEACGAVPHKVQSTPEDLSRDLPRLIRCQQEPFSTTSIYAQYRVMEALRQAGLKVTLDGQGADELFGGYSFHIGARIGSLVRQGRLGAAFTLARQADGNAGLTTKRHWSNAMDYVLPAGFRSFARNAAGKSLVPAWLDTDWCDRHGVAPDPYRTAGGTQTLKTALTRGLEGPGLTHLLRYEDRNSMAFGVESRVPFVSRPVIEFALSLPEEFLIGPQGETKTLLRQAMRGIVPDAVLDRRDKVAFQTPEDEWMKALAPWIDETLNSDAARRAGPLKADAALAHWNRVRSGEAAYGPAVWRWANLIEWIRAFDVCVP